MEFRRIAEYGAVGCCGWLSCDLLPLGSGLENVTDFTLMSGRGWCLRKGMCGGWIDVGNGDDAGCLWFHFGNTVP